MGGGVNGGDVAMWSRYSGMDGRGGISVGTVIVRLEGGCGSLASRAGMKMRENLRARAAEI